MEADPVAIDLNVDAALLLKDLVGIDSYPPVLALLPNIYNLEDRDRVRAVVAEQLAEAGILVDDRVHPAVAQWLRCLDRPDVELVVRIVETGAGGETPGMLRMSLVRTGESHVLALRNDDHVVIQPVFHEGRQLNTVAAALVAAVGQYPALRFEPMSATMQALTEVPEDLDERKLALVELGAQPHTAGLLSRVMGEVMRRAEVVMIEHRDGGSGSVDTGVCVSILDTASGRLVVTPSKAMDGEIWSTYAPGDDAAINASVAALVDLLPGRSWFDTTRAD
ncbi:ESX secretion-associated protein EspG [Nocardia cyriacigeorgica]|uniref:ESX secretion-associated protein EspG n=1 Tax=Nocardia cyriacigeorgica TaxID=135487 RepID=UPI002458D3D0|nr:ESX secretion-associated protein EspG [Nocardia cyriacigeorgica]